MPLLLRPTRTKTRFRWSRYFFFTLGTMLLLYVFSTLLATELYQDEQNREFEQTAARAVSPSPAKAEGALLGRIEIKSVGLSVMIQEGVAEETLRRAVGHVPGTPLLGEHGNIALAAHRDTFFRGLRNIRLHDEIVLTTTSGTTRYRVVFTQVVEPEETSVLRASEEDMLTLVTCYPFNFVGTAPQRFIVRAHKVPA
ncbi:MAG TPA: class D sortase [Blastocatellia bacterium]|nr:class D sortase [Blastocatellia bacterium]